MVERALGIRIGLMSDDSGVVLPLPDGQWCTITIPPRPVDLLRRLAVLDQGLDLEHGR